MKLFQRFPKLIWRPKETYPLVSKDEAEGNPYPDLKEDFELLDKILFPVFQRLDQQALKIQNQFWLGQVILIFGGAFATILGALQATFSATPVPCIIEAITAVLLATVAEIGRELKLQQSYFRSRLQAEALRSEYFLFLGRVAPYDDDTLRVEYLKDKIGEIESEDEA